MVPGRAGRHCGHSDRFEITRQDVNAFAGPTRDRQEIHVDPVRAADGPYGDPSPRFPVLEEEPVPP